MCYWASTNADFPEYLDSDRLKICAFYLRLSRFGGEAKRLPETLTLVYLPWMEGDAVEVNGSKVLAGSPAIVALHRVRSTGKKFGALFASMDRIQAREGVRFVAHVGEEEVVRGVFRRGGGDGGWRMECRSTATEAEVWVAEVWVAEVGGEVMRMKAEVGSRKEKRRMSGFCSRLEDIPEEEEGSDCCCEDREVKEEKDEEEGWAMVRSDGGEREGVRWAVEVGLWVVCLGVGLLVSKASSTSLMRKLI
ncbi:uncharacterized protein [Typha angustifolia]|uniref:uncharacterized protein n=1 Tax=Typha angustifolia TaxID=59011 RepID=UPI003C2E1867